MNRCATAGWRDWLHGADGLWNMLTLFFTVLGAAFGVGQGLYLVWKEAVSPCRLKRLRSEPVLRVPACVAAALLPMAVATSCAWVPNMWQAIARSADLAPPRFRAVVVVSGLAETGSSLSYSFLSHVVRLCRAPSIRHGKHRLREAQSPKVPHSQLRRSLRWSSKSLRSCMSSWMACMATHRNSTPRRSTRVAFSTRCDLRGQFIRLLEPSCPSMPQPCLIVCPRHSDQKGSGARPKTYCMAAAGQRRYSGPLMRRCPQRRECSATTGS